MKHRIIALILIIFLLVTTGISFAQDTQATVAAATLQVRAQPGNGEVIGSFSNGITVTVTGRENVDGNGGVWVVASSGGTTGWVLSDYLNFPGGFVIENLPIVAPDGAAVSGGSAPQPQPALVRLPVGVDTVAT